VLDSVDVTVPEGIIFALLGPNGAGKTTMVRILSTLLAADSGRTRVAGYDVSTDPAATMPAGLRQFATYQPFTPVTETLRGLLTGMHIGGNAIEAIAWGAGIAVASYLWARHLYGQRRAG
jgi:ABC-type branched-subunit amino acid transport system ATPase component